MSRIPDVLGEIKDADAGEWPKFVLEDQGKIIHTHSWETSWRIERHGIDKQNEKFEEEWTDVYQGPCYSDTAYIYHDSSPIHSMNIISADSGQAIIPQPTKIDGNWKISQLEEQIGVILSSNANLFYDKLDQAGIGITGDSIRPR